jgi:hypothetical protein
MNHLQLRKFRFAIAFVSLVTALLPVANERLHRGRPSPAKVTVSQPIQREMQLGSIQRMSSIPENGDC